MNLASPEPDDAAPADAETAAQAVRDEVDDRGEITLPLDGHEYHLRPSFEAIKACEKKLNMSHAMLAGRAQTNMLSISDQAIIAAEFMHAYARTHKDDPLHTDHAGAQPARLEELIFEAGGMRVQPRLAVLLIGALAGGVDKSGEWKAEALTTTKGTDASAE